MRLAPRQSRKPEADGVPQALEEAAGRGIGPGVPRLADASGLGFELWAPEIPITPGCTLEQALGDGEDYELLLAVSPKMKASMMHQWHCFSPKVPLTVIGQLLPLDGKSTNKLKGGWEHFR